MMETKTLMISGMSCGMCVKHVTHALKDVNGVTNVATDLESNTAVVTFDPAAAGLPEFKEAVAEAGYEVVGVA
jgi:copper chaperone